MVSAGHRHVAILTSGLPARAVCEDGRATLTCATASDATPDTAAVPARAARISGADVPVSKIFTQGMPGPWAGCPSPARVLAAWPDESSPERGIIRNDAVGKTVIATRLRRRHGNPGPPIRVCPKAVRTGGLPVGRPAMVVIAALRRKEGASVAPVVAAAPTWTRSAETDRAGHWAVPALTDIAGARPPVTDLGASANAGRAKAVPAAFAPATGGASGIRPGIMSFCDTAGAGHPTDALAASGASTAVRRKERKDKTCHSVAVTPAAGAAGCVGPMKKTKGPDFSGLCFVSR